MLRGNGVLAIGLTLIQGSRSESPQLAYLALRCVDRPIDLRPPFDPRQAIYYAELDFGEPSFAVDAQPTEGSDFVNPDDISSTRLVAPGDQVISTLKVKNSKTQEHLDYSITVHRLTGEETHLRALHLPGVSLEPSFTEETEDYTVLMPAELDRLHIEAVLLDAGQTLKVTSEPTAQEHHWISTTTTPMWDQSYRIQEEKKELDGLKPRTEVVASKALEKESRRLMYRAGELQRALVRRSFPVEVNGSRLVKLTVHAAGDPAFRTYRLFAFRAPCPPERPFYAPDVRLCAMTCNDGYFPRRSSSRCETCPEHCVRCRSWQLCEECETSYWQSLHFVRLNNGRCDLLRIHWRDVLFGLCVFIAGISIFFCFCFACCFGSTSRPKRRRMSIPSKETEQAEQSQRLLKATGFSDDEDA